MVIAIKDFTVEINILHNKTGSRIKNSSQYGFTLIELLVVAAIIAILLAIAIPNLIKARISANEANARKAMQTLRDAEYEFFEQDLDGDGKRDFTSLIGTLNTDDSLRSPEGSGTEFDALIDFSFEAAVVNDGDVATSATCGSGSKAGYCIGWSDEYPANSQTLIGDFGWEASPKKVRVLGRHDFSVYSDKSIKCTLSSKPSGEVGIFESQITDGLCD